MIKVFVLLALVVSYRPVCAEDFTIDTAISVSDPLIPLISTDTYSVYFFDNDNVNIGTLYLDKTGIRFVGKAEESARVFFDYLRSDFDEYKICACSNSAKVRK